MRKNMGKIVASILSVALVFSVPIASKVINTQVNADDYQLVWSDEFNGESLDSSNWTVETGTGSNNDGWGNNELQFYRNSPENIEISDGTLKIHALKQNYGGKKYTSARMKTQGKRSFTYGKIEAKMKLPSFSGAWPAFWTLGENITSVGWPACGEMDIMEAINANNNIYSNLHWSYKGTQADTQGSVAYDVGDRTEWHTYTMEWTSTRAKFYCDGELYQSNGITTEAEMEEFRKNQFIILNLAIGGKWPGYTIDDSAFPDRSTMEVDYVRVYQKPETPTTKYDGPTVIVTEDSVKKYTGTWNKYFSNVEQWVKTSGELYPNSKPSDGYTIEVDNCGRVVNDSMWSVQGNLERLPYYTNSTYTYKCTLVSSVDKKVVVKVADGDEQPLAQETYTLSANVPKKVQLTVNIPDDFESIVSLKFGWGKMDGDSIADGGSFTAHVSDVSFVTTTSIPDPAYTTTPAPTTTTKAPTTTTKTPTTKASTTVAPTTKAPTTKAPVVTTKTPTTKKPTTKAPVTTKKKVKKPKRVKITRVYRKKKSLKVRIKRIKKVKGYHVVYSDDKHFVCFDEKYVKKITFKLKKLDRKTKYYIKVRAYRKSGNKYIDGRFSNTKKARTR